MLDPGALRLAVLQTSSQTDVGSLYALYIQWSNGNLGTTIPLPRDDTLHMQRKQTHTIYTIILINLWWMLGGSQFRRKSWCALDDVSVKTNLGGSAHSRKKVYDEDARTIRRAMVYKMALSARASNAVAVTRFLAAQKLNTSWLEEVSKRVLLSIEAQLIITIYLYFRGI